jgi:hypothetical protein
MNQNWWLHGRSRPALRHALEGLQRCIVTSEVAKHRIFAWMNTGVVPDHTLHIIARDDDYFFGVLQSKIHVMWSLCLNSTLEDRPRYNSETTFETFPFPWPPFQEPKDSPLVRAIAEAARELVQKRDAWLSPPVATEQELKSRTLTNLYNVHPSWLVEAHRKLDEAVSAAYGWLPTLTDAEVLEHLLTLNQQRAARANTRAIAQHPAD